MNLTREPAMRPTHFARAQRNALKPPKYCPFVLIYWHLTKSLALHSHHTNLPLTCTFISIVTVSWHQLCQITPSQKKTKNKKQKHCQITPFLISPSYCLRVLNLVCLLCQSLHFLRSSLSPIEIMCDWPLKCIIEFFSL